MILEKKVHVCSKCHSKAVIKNGKNTCGNQQYHCKTRGAYGILEPHDRYTEEEKERIINSLSRTMEHAWDLTESWNLSPNSKRLVKKKQSSFHPLRRR